MNSSIFSFEGRIKRSEFWLIFFLLCLYLFVLVGIAEVEIIQAGSEYTSNIEEGYWLTILVLVMLPIWIEYAAYVKRLHDLGRNGAYALFALVPLINIIFLLWVGCASGDTVANKYGEKPQ